MGERSERLVRMLEEALGLPPSEFRELYGRWKALEPEMKKVLRALEHNPTASGRLSAVLLEVEKSASGLLDMISRASSGDGLRLDWERFAERRAVQLKDWLLGLREVLISISDAVEIGLLRQELECSTGLNVEELFLEMRRRGVISEATWLRVKEALSSGGWATTPEIRETVRRISRIFLQILDREDLGEG